MRVDSTAEDTSWTPGKALIRHRRGRHRRPDVDVAEARGLRECAERRARVLAFPDLAHELTLPPLRYPTPEHWNGYIPPAVFDGQPNESPRRRALVLLGQTVAQAEKEAADAVVQG